MKSLEKKFGERIEDIASQYGTYKEAAKSLGVSTRTLRRWRKRKSAPGGTTKFDNRKLRRRERYYYVEKPKRIYRQREQAGIFRQSPATTGTLDLAAFMPGAISPWQVRDLLEGRFFGESGAILREAIARGDSIFLQMWGQSPAGKMQSHIVLLDDYEGISDFISDVYESASRFYGSMGSGSIIAMGPQPMWYKQ